jgi:transposase
MEADVSYTPERLDHLGIVAGICREIGLAELLDGQTEPSRQRVSIGTATVAMVLNGLGFSNRRLYLVPQFFENKPVERLLGDGVKACDLNDDCLGRTLDRLYDHDVTRLFAGIARRAREVFDVGKRRMHVDTTSFSVSGEYDGDHRSQAAAAAETDEALINITHGYSRDHRADLKQWMLALATTHEGDIPLFMKPLDGNSSDKATLVSAVEALKEQLRDSEEEEEEEEEEASIFVADSGLYSEANMTRLSEAGVRWVSRVPEISKTARSIIDLDASDWCSSPDAQMRWYRREVAFGGGLEEEVRTERWVVVSSQAAEERAEKTLRRKMEKERKYWESVLRTLAGRKFACETDARGALSEQIERLLPAYLQVQEVTLKAQPRYAGRGRPKNGQQPIATDWRIEGTLSVVEQRARREWRRRACYIVGTSVLDPEILSEEELIATYKGQGSVERGFRFLKDPLFLASSVFVQKPERLVALGFVMVVCLLVYRLAEHRLRKRLSETGQSIPNQIGKPTARPTMRWVFQLFEGIELLIIRSPESVSWQVLRLKPVHERILRLLGPTFQKIYGAPN